jgi:hypothetical protein
MRLISVIACVAMLAACDTTPAGTTPTVVDSLIGKKLTAGDTILVLNPDGTIGGSSRGSALIGNYSATSAQICSSYSAPKGLAGLGEICSVPVIAGDTVIFNRTDGTKSPLFTITEG